MTTHANEVSAEALLSQERLLVDTEWLPRERLEVRRRVVTESRQVTVTVRREELLIDRVPLDAGPVPEPASSPEPLVVVLHEEVPVVEMQVRAYERVTVGVERVVGEQVLRGVLGREEAELVDDGRPRP